MNLETSPGFFYQLTPDQVLEAVESSGLRCTGRCQALNSFENRVYDVELESPEDGPAEGLKENKVEISNRRIVKFYRPGRWSREQILAEHEFLSDLNHAEIPAIGPILFPEGGTLQTMPKSGIHYALFPRVGGRAPDELTDDQLLRVGRLLGRIHAVGISKPGKGRLRLDVQSYGLSNLKFLLDENWVPLEFQKRYQVVVENICKLTEPWFEAVTFQRVHGDCHLGNLLWNQAGPFFLDFDDMVVGPPVQDIWLLVPGRDPESLRQRQVLLEGYQEFRTFDMSSLKLIEVLRALRFVHYSTWLARRWSDPAFPLAFPQFGTHQYWSSEVDDLEQQWRLIS